MSYSVTPILHTREVKKGLRKVQIRVIFDRQKYYATTDIRLAEGQLVDGKVTKHKQEDSLNIQLAADRLAIETRLQSLITKGTATPENIKLAVTGKEKSFTMSDVLAKVTDHYRARVSNNTIHNYTVSVKKLIEFKPGIQAGQCTQELLGRFEQWMRLQKEKMKEGENEIEVDKYNINTISKYMQMLKSVLNKANSLGLVDKDVYDGYRRPKPAYPLPVWLTIPEVDKLSEIVAACGDDNMKQAGYYFLLCCYAGYRISDAKSFDYSKAYSAGRLTIRADKNKRIVSIPVFDKLAKVLQYCKTQRMTLSEQKAREHIKSLCKVAGIKKDVKFHSARHSFGMMLMAKGFTIDEAAELLGDTPLVSKVYARVHNHVLDSKILERLG